MVSPWLGGSEATPQGCSARMHAQTTRSTTARPRRPIRRAYLHGPLEPTPWSIVDLLFRAAVMRRCATTPHPAGTGEGRGAWRVKHCSLTRTRERSGRQAMADIGLMQVVRPGNIDRLLSPRRQRETRGWP
jgi:hypothetical protein